MKYLIFIFTTVTLSACSSAPRNGPDYSHVGEESVIQTQGDESLKNALPFRLDGNTYISTAFVTIPGDHLVSSGIKMAQASARSLISKTVSAKLSNYIQVSTEGTSGDTQNLREVIDESSSLIANRWLPGKTLVLKVKVIGDNGIPRTENRIYAEMTIESAEFHHQVVESIRSQQTANKASVAFSQAVDRNFQKLIGDDPKAEEKRQPAAEEMKTKASE
jgi:hypothetical protein